MLLFDAVFKRSAFAHSAQPQLDDARRRQIGQFQTLWQSQLPFADLFCENRFWDALGKKGPVDDVLLEKVFSDPGQHCRVHQVLHLIGHSWHGDEEPVLMFKSHGTGRSHIVLPDEGIAGQFCLIPVQVRDVPSHLLKKRLDMGKDLLIELQLTTEIARERVLGQIVFGGPEPSGDQHQLGICMQAIQCLDDGLRGIAYGMDAVHLYAHFIQLLAHPGRIGINGLSDEDLISYRDQFCLHLGTFFLIEERLQDDGRTHAVHPFLFPSLLLGHTCLDHCLNRHF